MAAQWFRCLRPLAQPRARLICFPYAGGGAGLFHQWPGRLAPGGIEVWAAQLPGRENRIQEPPLDNMVAVIPQLATNLPDNQQVPVAFFGHSMGALLAFELARHLRRTGRPEPHILFTAAAAAPHFPAQQPHLHALPRPEFLAAMETRYDGIPAAVRDHDELLDLLLPMLRADMRLVETYAYRPESPLSLPIEVTGGIDDGSVTRPELNGWRQHTAGTFRLHLLPGDHFFVQQQAAQFLTLLTERLDFHLANRVTPRAYTP